MSTPIKERGIKWVETYDDKSAYLRSEMEKQIGRGSYLRWEGHDHTTGNDYYVVISPGFSKKKGYYFFAGLRKMPADQGASGKKFKTQQEALSYAMNMWNVPRPKEKPAKAYTTIDIQNKPIVLEPQHDSKNASTDNRLVIVSEQQKQAMSMAVSAGTTSNFVPRFGEKTFPEMLCWAFRASPVMGFMAALNTRKRMIGTDVINVGANSTVKNNLTGNDNEQAPLAPVYATCASPSPEEFNERTNGGHEDNPLIKIKRSGGKIVNYEPQKPMMDEDSENYSLYRWKDLRMVAKVTLPTNVFFSPQAKQAWSELGILSRQNVRKPNEYKDIPHGAYNEQTGVPGIDFPPEIQSDGSKYKKNNIAVKFAVDPKIYLQFEKKMAELMKSVPGHEHMSPKINIADQNQQNLADLLKHYNETGQEFDWNTPCYERMRVGKTQLMVYDSLGFPLGMRMGVDNANTRVTQEGKEIADSGQTEAKKKADRREATYVLKNPIEMVGKNTSPISIHVGHKMMEIEQLDNQIATWQQKQQKDSKTDSNLSTHDAQIQQLSSKRDAIKSEVKQIIDAWKSGDAQTVQGLARQLLTTPEVQRWSSVVDNGRGGQKFSFLEKVKESKDRFFALKEAVKKKYLAGQDFTNEQNEMRAIHKDLQPILAGFRTMSSNNLVRLGHEDVADSRTCAPEMMDVISDAFHVDGNGLPLDQSNKLADGQAGRGNFDLSAKKKTYSPRAVARAKVEQGPNGQIHAARYFNPSEKWVDQGGRTRIGRYIYDKIPDNVQPAQDMTGLPVVVDSPVMYVPDGKGGLRKLTKSIWQKRDPNSHGKFIPGGVFDVGMAPPEESAKKSGKKIISSGGSNDSFIATQEEHCAKELDFISNSRVKAPYSLRQLPPEPLFGYDPQSASGKKFYTMNKSDGSSVDLSSAFEKRSDGYVHSSNTGLMMELVKRQLGINDDKVGAFTPLTNNGIRLIYEASAEGIHYHDAIEAAKSNDSTNPLFAEGQKIIQAGIDEKKYNYGKICKTCTTGGDVVHPEIAKAYQQAIENPVESFKVSQGKVFLIQQTDAQGQTSNSQDEEGNMFMFGSKMAADRALSMPYFASKSGQMKFTVVESDIQSMSSHIFGHDAADGVTTLGYDKVVNQITQYKQGKTVDQVESEKPQQPDKHQDQYAPVGDIGKTNVDVERSARELVQEMSTLGKPPEQMKNDLETMKSNPNASDFLKKVYDRASQMIEVPVKPEQQVDPLGEIDPATVQPKQQPAPQAAPAPAAVPPPAAGPVSPATPTLGPSPIDIQKAKRFFSGWIGIKKTPQQMATEVEYYKNSPMYPELKKLVDQYSGSKVNAEQIGKLVALANKLDEQGRHAQADRIDKLVNAALKSGLNHADSQR